MNRTNNFQDDKQTFCLSEVKHLMKTVTFLILHLGSYNIFLFGGLLVLSRYHFFVAYIIKGGVLGGSLTCRFLPHYQWYGNLYHSDAMRELSLKGRVSPHSYSHLWDLSGNPAEKETGEMFYLAVLFQCWNIPIRIRMLPVVLPLKAFGGGSKLEETVGNT